MASLKIFLVLILFAAEGLAIKCYICNSLTDPNCENSPDPLEYLKDCKDLPEGSKYNLCRKINQSVPPGSLGNTSPRVIRSCAYEPSKIECVLRSGLGVEQRVCTCDTDACNSANNFPIAKTFMALLCVISVILPKIFS